jgi:hypothetical protein
MQRKRRMKNKVKSRIIPALPSTDIIRTIKAARLRWAEHPQRMGNNEIPRRIMDSKFEGSRRVG